uniref:Cadherin domain-containing protein n=2 Tax=Biomphalaria TaxID=6525 RepID=A0A2C9L463_BIOGL
MTYKVTDKGGLSATATTTLTVYDINDNPPYFKTNAYSFAATECTDLGTVIGKVTGDDDDSSYRQNDKIIFGGSGGKMAVMSNGDVVLTQACVNGES